MRIRMMTALLLAIIAVGPASAQRSPQAGGVRTETMTRLADQGAGRELLWNALGLLGLLGLIGLRKQHGDDSYHPAAFE